MNVEGFLLLYFIVSLSLSDKSFVIGILDIFAHDSFTIQSFFVHRFKYCVASFSICALHAIYLLGTMALKV